MHCERLDFGIALMSTLSGARGMKTLPNAFGWNGMYIAIIGLRITTAYNIISSDRSSYSDDGLVYIQRPLFEIFSIYAFL